MNKFLLLLLLIIIPCLLLFTGILIKEAGGPYYLNYYDPGYVYLVNSINVLQLSTVGHFDHPGTSVQIFGAVILKFLFITRTIDHDTLKEIFSDPEYFLTILNTSMVVINCIALFLLGLLTFKLTKNIYLSLLLQLSPFVSFEIFYGLVIFSPENFLILSCIGVMVLLIFYIYNEKVEKNLTFALVFGFICGFGVVSKMNFLPIFLIPLIIIRGWKYKLIFLVSSLVVFLVILLPVLPDYTSFFTWVKNLVINTGIHGKSGGSDLKVISYFNNIVTIFSKDLIMFIIYLIMVISLFLSYRIKNKEEDEFSAIIKKNRLVLFSIIAAVSFQVLIVAKNYLIYVQYYVIPSLML
ncbi:MAG: hypothetical protein ABI462_01140, partial [Ignavibacteria bacterium]